MNSSYRREGEGVPQRALRTHAEKGAAAVVVQVRVRRRSGGGFGWVGRSALLGRSVGRGRSVGLLQAEE